MSSGTIVSDLNSNEVAAPVQTENLINLNQDFLPETVQDPPPPSPYTLRNKKFSIGSTDSFYDEPYSNLEEIDVGITPVPNFSPPPPPTLQSTVHGATPEEEPNTLEEEPNIHNIEPSSNKTSFPNHPYGVMDKPEDEAVVMEVKDIETESAIQDFDEVLNSLLLNEPPNEFNDKPNPSTRSDDFDSTVMLF